MKLIVGLGNPGKEYNNTRHNVGFMVLDNHLGDIKWQTKFNAKYYEENKNGEKIIYVKPETFMNLSGDAVIRFIDFYKIELKDILVIHDDLALEIGKYRIKINSSSGGHNGIKSIINRLNSDAFARLKIGVSNNKMIDTKDYVLGKFSKEENSILEELLPTFNSIIDHFIQDDIVKLMNDYNKK